MNIQLSNVRLSYPQLFKPKAFAMSPVGQGQSEPKFSAVAILDKAQDAKQIQILKDGMKAVAEEKWGVGKIPKGIKVCVRDGAEKEGTEGYGPDIVFVSTSSAKRIPIVDRNLTPLVEEDGKPYAGCYINLSLRLWAQDNQYGKRINAQLRAVQFVKDGEAFGDKPADPKAEFKSLEGEADPLG